MIRAKRRVIRETAEIHGPTGKPFVIRIDAGGKTISVKIKGRRTWYTVTVRQVWTQGGWNLAAAIRAEKKRLRLERKAANSA